MAKKQSPRERLSEIRALEDASAESLAGLRLIVKEQSKTREAKLLLAASELKSQELSDAVACYESLRAVDFKPIKIKQGKSKKGKSPHSFLALASDWHSLEIVESSETGGRNEHNENVGRERAVKYFTDLVSLVRESQSRFLIDDLILWLGGDFMVGEIHGVESSRACNFTPLEEIAAIKEILIGGIDFLLSELDVSKIRIPCNPGNHGRSTQEYRYRKSMAYSYEAYLYKDLAIHYANEPRLDFDVSDEAYKVVDVGGFRIGFHHGHEIRYGGGVGGLSVPFRRSFYRLQNTYKMDAMAIGHFHQYGFYSGVGFTNGSLVGWNSYAAGKGLAFEMPAQIAALISHERHAIGRVMPIWVD